MVRESATDWSSIIIGAQGTWCAAYTLTHLCVCVSGSSRASWMCQKPISDALKLVHLDTDSASESSGDPPPAPPTNSTLRHGSVRESDILGDNDDGFSERLARRDSTPGSIEARFHELCLSDGAREEPEGREVNSPETQPQLRRAHFSAVRRRSARSEPRRSPAALLNLRQHSHSLDNPSDSAVVSVDLNALLERDFSVQSLTSVINEDCFYENGTTATTS